MKLHSTTLRIFEFELYLYPILFLLHYGIGMDIGSSYWLRFIYIGYFIIGFSYIVKNKIIVINPLTLTFFIIIIVGGIKGLALGNFNSNLLAHVFYLLMPIVMISYGWHFSEWLLLNKHNMMRLRRIMVRSLIVGILSIIIFRVLYQIGLSSYDAIDIWNIVLSTTYLATNGATSGLSYLLSGVALTFIAGKRGLIIALAIVMSTYLFMMKSNSKFLISIFIILVVVAAAYTTQESSGFIRMERTISALQEGDFDTASARRWSEAASALQYVDNSFLGWFIGSGFGSSYNPWPDLIDSENYQVHYAHFSFVSYIFVGGVFLPLVVYGSLFLLIFSVGGKINAGMINKEHAFFFHWLLLYTCISLFGAILMNNSFIWLVVGSCYKLSSVNFSQQTTIRRSRLKTIKITA